MQRTRTFLGRASYTQSASQFFLCSLQRQFWRELDRSKPPPIKTCNNLADEATIAHYTLVAFTVLGNEVDLEISRYALYLDLRTCPLSSAQKDEKAFSLLEKHSVDT